MRDPRRAPPFSRLWLTVRSLEDLGDTPSAGVQRPIGARARALATSCRRSGLSRSTPCQPWHRGHARITRAQTRLAIAGVAPRATVPLGAAGEQQHNVVTTSVGRMQELSTYTSILCARTASRRGCSTVHLAKFITSSLCGSAVLVLIRRISERCAKAVIAGGPHAVNDV